MANVDPTAYALTEWMAAIIAETTAGTINKTAMQLVNIDSPASLTRNPELFTGMRSGVGRTPKVADSYGSENGKIKTIQMSGLYDTTIGKILLENVTGTEVSTGPASVDIVGSYTNEITLGATELSDNIHTLSFVNIVPGGLEDSEYYPGCVVSELKLAFDTANDGGRWHFDTTLLTRGNSEMAVAPTSPAAFGSTKRSIYELTAASNAVMTMSTLGAEADVILDSAEITFASTPEWCGLGVNGVGDAINRASAGWEVNGVFGVKFDANTSLANVDYKAGTTVAVAMHNNVWASATFGWLGSYGIITGDVNQEDVRSGAYVKIPIKFRASTTGDLFQIIP